MWVLLIDRSCVLERLPYVKSGNWVVAATSPRMAGEQPFDS